MIPYELCCLRRLKYLTMLRMRKNMTLAFPLRRGRGDQPAAPASP